MIKIEGYDTGEVYYFDCAEELFEFLEVQGEYWFEQNLIYLNNFPAFIRR